MLVGACCAREVRGGVDALTAVVRSPSVVVRCCCPMEHSLQTLYMFETQCAFACVCAPAGFQPDAATEPRLRLRVPLPRRRHPRRRHHCTRCTGALCPCMHVWGWVQVCMCMLV